MKEFGIIEGMTTALSSLYYALLIVVTVLCSLLITRATRRTFTRFRSREQKAGKELIYRHFPKKKKPLGGGVAIFTTLVLSLFFAWLLTSMGLLTAPTKPVLFWRALLIWLFSGIIFGAIGLIDDWRKVIAARGLSEWVKLLLQFVCATVITLLITAWQLDRFSNPTAVFFPFVGWVQLNFYYLPFGILVIIGASNAVNLTDGMDGLAGSSLSIAFVGYLLLGVLLHQESVPLLIPIIVLATLAGFLFYNMPPAKIIMGDTGALGLGAALGTLALFSRTEWLLLLFAAPFLIDTVSVMIQVGVIKFFRGPVKLLRHQTTEIFRPFLCTPLHHHFQWLTWGPWPILAIFSSVGILSMLLGLLALPAMGRAEGFGWFWLTGLFIQATFLTFAALQKVVRANFFLGLERPDNNVDRVLALYKGLPIEILGMRGYTIEEITDITEVMINTIAAESILWRNISEIEARATLGKIYAEYKLFDLAAKEWEEIPLRNLLIRENLVVQLGKIYFGRDELLRAIKLWEELPPARLYRVPGLSETIQSAKVRVGHLAGRLYHQAREHAATLAKQSNLPSPSEVTALINELDGVLRYTQDLRDLLAYEQQKNESSGATDHPDGSIELYRRMDASLTARHEELHEALRWAEQLRAPAEGSPSLATLHALASALEMTSTEISHALGVKIPVPVASFSRISKPSRNSLYRITLETPVPNLPLHLVAKCFQESKVTFFSACYRRERGVVEILQQANAPVPRLLGGHLGSHQGVLFMEDVGTVDLASALLALPKNDIPGQIALLKRGIDTLVTLRMQALPIQQRLEREIAKIVKEVLTPEYYSNTTTIALNRILALDHRQLSAVDRERLELALRPLLAHLLDEPKTFIHFEYTPGNLHLLDNRVIAMDFEQSTMGPAAFDLATLLYNPEANLGKDDIQQLLAYYHEILPVSEPSPLMVHQSTLEAATIMKMLFYAGAAANFYRKFEDGARLSAMEWYLRTTETLLAEHIEYLELAQLLRQYWKGQTHLPV